MSKFNNGVYPTMITPYDEKGNVDYGAVKALVEWYWEKGCEGIFASCQSSEIFRLSLKDRLGLAKTVKDTADALAAKDKSREAMTIVASGHTSDDFEEQVDELRRMADTGVDAVVLICNRSDIANTTEDKWIEETGALLDRLPTSVKYGTYECPYPYRRLLTPKMLEWMKGTGRFAFIKDTVSDVSIIKERLEILADSDIKLFNANAQTLLDTLRLGAYGYSGPMANFHPELYVWLCKNFDKEPEKAEWLYSFLSTASFTEQLAYPCTAKYQLDTYDGIHMAHTSRTKDVRLMTQYDKSSIDRMKHLADWFAKELGL
ncbi:MAG: dihydrodipicolinate synthase family protein [Christensenellaceae bacterium]|nr:dihydrodipicolinate synthase family protein [Christensenellaceae bacterium]